MHGTDHPGRRDVLSRVSNELAALVLDIKSLEISLSDTLDRLIAGDRTGQKSLTPDCLRDLQDLDRVRQAVQDLSTITMEISRRHDQPVDNAEILAKLALNAMGRRILFNDDTDPQDARLSDGGRVRLF